MAPPGQGRVRAPCGAADAMRPPTMATVRPARSGPMRSGGANRRAVSARTRDAFKRRAAKPTGAIRGRRLTFSPAAAFISRMADTLIRGGTVVTEAGRRRADVLIHDGR